MIQNILSNLAYFQAVCLRLARKETKKELKGGKNKWKHRADVLESVMEHLKRSNTYMHVIRIRRIEKSESWTVEIEANGMITPVNPSKKDGHHLHKSTLAAAKKIVNRIGKNLGLGDNNIENNEAWAKIGYKIEIEK
jgi:hypothetical protein